MNKVFTKHGKFIKGFSHSKKVGALVLVSFLILASLITMLALVPKAEAGGTMPSASGSHYAYVHWEELGGQMWANANANDEDDGGTTTRQAIEEEETSHGYGFAVRANMEDDSELIEPLYFEENGIITGRARVEFQTAPGTDSPDEITFFVYELDGDGNEVWKKSTTIPTEEDDIYEFSIDIDATMVPSGNIFTVAIGFSANPGVTTITFHTSGETYFILPLVEAPNGNGGDGGNGNGGNGNGNGDGGDGNGDNGEEDDDNGGDVNTNLIIGIIVVVCVIVLIVVAISISRKRGK